MINDLIQIAEQLNRTQIKDKLENLKIWSQKNSNHIVFCGEFKRGKSSLINALLGKDICPADILPATAIPSIVEYGPSFKCTVHWKNGQSKRILETSELFKYTIDGAITTEDIRWVKISLPSDLLKEGLVFIDTPGVNDMNKQVVDVTYKFLPMSDAIVFLLDSTMPVSKTESQFLEKYIFKEVCDNIIFVLSKSDRLDEEDLEDSLDGARERLTKILGKPPQLIAASSKLARKGQKESIQPLINAIRGVQTRCQEQKQATYEKRLFSLAKDMSHFIEQRTLTIGQTESERRQQYNSYEQLSLQHRARFQKLEAYISMYGEQTLLDLISVSVEKLGEKLHNETLFHIDNFSGNFESYLKQQLPHYLNQQFQGWCQQNGQQIEIYLKKFIHQISQDFALQFGGLPSGSSLINAPHIEREKVITNKVEDMLVQKLIPTALPMAAGLIILGPIGLVAGGMVGQLASIHIQEQKQQAQQEEAKLIIGDQVSQIIARFKYELHREVRGWFSSLKEQCTEQLQLLHNENRALLADPSENEKNKLSELAQQLSNIQQHYTEKSL